MLGYTLKVLRPRTHLPRVQRKLYTSRFVTGAFLEAFGHDAVHHYHSCVNTAFQLRTMQCVDGLGSMGRKALSIYSPLRIHGNRSNPSLFECFHSIMERAVERGLKIRDVDNVRRVGIDEKSFGKGQDYISLMTTLASTWETQSIKSEARELGAFGKE